MTAVKKKNYTCYCSVWNELAAKISGVNTTKTIFGVYVIAGALAGLGCSINSKTDGRVTYCRFGLWIRRNSCIRYRWHKLAGGIGTIPGAFLGALAVGVIKNGMDLLNVSDYYQLIVKGFIIILAVSIENNLIGINKILKHNYIYQCKESSVIR